MPGNFSCVLIGIASILFDKLWIEAYNIQCYKDKLRARRNAFVPEGWVAMIIAVIDGMGGGLGAQVVTQLTAQLGEKAEVIALGTNALATNNMVRAGAARGATGENAVRVSLRKADIVVGPIGIVIPNAMMGEITPQIAELVASADAGKILIPVNQNHFSIVGLEAKPLVNQIREAVARVTEIVKEKEGKS